jgi:hypothetical protein
MILENAKLIVRAAGDKRMDWKAECEKREVGKLQCTWSCRNEAADLRLYALELVECSASPPSF